MKKKCLVTMAATLALVGTVGAGATLAYMTAKTNEVRNTFTFAEAGIGIALDECVVDAVTNKAVADGGRTSQGQSYQNIVPGMIIDKDPTVTILANSLNCNVFASVTNANGNNGLSITDFGTDAWKVINPADYGLEAADEDTIYYVYQGDFGTGEVEDNDAFVVVPCDAENATVLEDIFETITISAELTEETEFSDIVIKAAAVQADSCTDAAAANTALSMLGAVVAE